jgi:hypothetical protein
VHEINQFTEIIKKTLSYSLAQVLSFFSRAHLGLQDSFPPTSICLQVSPATLPPPFRGSSPTGQYWPSTSSQADACLARPLPSRSGTFKIEDRATTDDQAANVFQRRWHLHWQCYPDVQVRTRAAPHFLARVCTPCPRSSHQRAPARAVRTSLALSDRAGDRSRLLRFSRVLQHI